MTQTQVPDDVSRFIGDCVPSVPLLEALLLLRSEPARSWDSFNVASRLYVGENEAHELLLAMEQSGLARRREDGSYAFAPRTGELAGVIDALAATYAHNLVGITDLIHSRRALCDDLS
ncbi:MAG TPA: hypothetical protein VFM98_07520 [Ramlibacter sp.]|uniref:hypothetical protein n=1 Tax=Ramlibacter sp. TaxID=1917967 RepID=UPI002D7F6FCF|nr:hypothetical protein [Ramlibacter sp.]HET8745437.1 hypothetical protein [Ramlibacter sp.]